MDKVQRLDQMKLFDFMSDDDLHQWAERFRREKYAHGEVVVREDDRAMAFYVVHHGELRAQARMMGEKLPRAYFYPGDYFGETGLLTGQPRNATVDVIENAELFVLDKLDFDEMIKAFPSIRDMLHSVGRQREAAGRTRFPWQREEEVTVFFDTKHWVALLRALRFTFLLAILAAFASAVYLSSIGETLTPIFSTILMIVAGTLLGLTGFFLIYHFLDWRNDQYIVTNRRIVHIERVLLLREDRDEAPLDRVEDLQVDQDGVWANLLDYGDIVIQTAAATEKIIFSHVHHPNYVREALFSPMKYAGRRATVEKQELIRKELRRRLKIEAPEPEGQASESALEVEPPPEEGVEEQEPPSLGIVRWVRRGLQWLRDLVTFETCIISDGGNTITWRKNGWRLLGVSLRPIFAALFVSGLALLFLSGSVRPSRVGWFLLFLLLPIFAWWFYVYWDWQNDIYQVSGNRLIDLKRRPFFLEEIYRETTLERVQHVSLSIPGPIAQLLNYGTVVIETAGEAGSFDFKYVHDPRRVQEDIFNRLENFKQKEREAQQRDRNAAMAEWFEVYHELRQEQDKQGVFKSGIETD